MLQSIFISLALIFITSSCTKQAEESIYVLPDNYVGYVVIFYNQSDGVDRKYIGSKRVYEIPSNGILRTRFSPDYGRTEFPEFYFNEITKFNQIPVVIDSKDFFENKPNATLPSLGKVYEKLDGSEYVEYAILFIGTKNEIKEYSSKIEKINLLEL